MATAVPVSGGTEIAAAHTAMSGVPAPTGNHGVRPGEARRLARFGPWGREAVTGKVACAGSRAPTHPGEPGRCASWLAPVEAPPPRPPPPGTEAGPRTPGFRWLRWRPSVRHLALGSRRIGGAPRKANILSALVAPAARRRARLSGAIRCQRMPAIGRSRSHWLLADRGSGGQGGAFPPGTARQQKRCPGNGGRKEPPPAIVSSGGWGSINAGVRAAAGCCSRGCKRRVASSTAGRGARRRHSGGAGP